MQSLLKSVRATQIYLGDNDERDIPEHFPHCADCPSLSRSRFLSRCQPELHH